MPTHDERVAKMTEFRAHLSDEFYRCKPALNLPWNMNDRFVACDDFAQGFTSNWPINKGKQDHTVKLRLIAPDTFEQKLDWIRDNVNGEWSFRFDVEDKKSVIFSFAEMADAAFFRLKF